LNNLELSNLNSFYINLPDCWLVEWRNTHNCFFFFFWSLLEKYLKYVTIPFSTAFPVKLHNQFVILLCLTYAPHTV
jgi:hypothetical protein